MSETKRECFFCDFVIEAEVRRTVADRLMASHFEENHEREIAPLTVSVDGDRRLLVQFGDLIDRFEEEAEKRLNTVALMKELCETFRKRIADAEAGIDRRLLPLRKEVMPMNAHHKYCNCIDCRSRTALPIEINAFTR